MTDMTDDEIADIIKSDKWLAAMQKVIDKVPDPFVKFPGKEFWTNPAPVTLIDRGTDGVEIVPDPFIEKPKPKLTLIKGGKYE